MNDDSETIPVNPVDIKVTTLPADIMTNKIKFMVGVSENAWHRQMRLEHGGEPPDLQHYLDVATSGIGSALERMQDYASDLPKHKNIDDTLIDLGLIMRKPQGENK